MRIAIHVLNGVWQVDRTCGTAHSRWRLRNSAGTVCNCGVRAPGMGTAKALGRNGPVPGFCNSTVGRASWKRSPFFVRHGQRPGMHRVCSPVTVMVLSS